MVTVYVYSVDAVLQYAVCSTVGLNRISTIRLFLDHFALAASLLFQKAAV